MSQEFYCEECRCAYFSLLDRYNFDKPGETMLKNETLIKCAKCAAIYAIQPKAEVPFRRIHL